MKIKYVPFTTLLILLSLPSTAHPFGGPLQVRNQLPIFLHADQPYIERAGVEDSISLSLSHSSTYIVQASQEWVIDLDMEITEFNMRLKKVIKGMELDIDVPLLILSDGFLDGFLNAYHSTFGFGDYGRPERPLNSFLYEIRREGVRIIKGEEGFGLGDIRVGAKRLLYSSDGSSIGIKGGVELPTGDADKGFGSGGLDADIALLIDRRVSDRLMSYWNIGAVHTGDLRTSRRLNLRDFLYAGLAVEGMLNKHLGLLVQLEAHPSIYPETGLEAIDTCACLLVFGGRYYRSGDALEFSITEDIAVGSAPDFIINITYKKEI